MKGFFKFLLLGAANIIVGVAVAAVLTLVVALLSQFTVGRWLIQVVNDGHASEVVTLVSNCVAYYVCALFAAKIMAYKPYRALCIVGAIFAIYSIISGIVHGENVIPYIIRGVICLVFFAKADELIK